MSLEDTLKRFIEKEIVIQNEDGYHYGTLIGHDSHVIYLTRYYRDKTLIDLERYGNLARWGQLGTVPKRTETPASVQLIPLEV